MFGFLVFGFQDVGTDFEGNDPIFVAFNDIKSIVIQTGTCILISLKRNAQ